MSILGTIASDVSNVLSDPGKLVTDVVDAVLPSKLKSVGDLAGGVVDVVVGKEPQAISHFKDSLKDLPQLTGAAADGPDQGGPLTIAAAAASPPPSSAPSAEASSSPSADQPLDVASLLALPSDQFMKAVSGGAVPAGVADDPAAMLQIQARVNDIAQMNQLVTSMMSAMHQMQMSIAQNIRA